MVTWPITLREIEAARDRIRPYLPPTPLRAYPSLDRLAGNGIRLLVKHENHNPTNSFKARNGVSVLTALTPEERAAGVVAATRGNHGQALAWAGAELDVPVTLCVPVGNNPEKNDAMRSFGATLIEEGQDYDDAVAVAGDLARRQGLRVVHATNDAQVLCGAATISLEIFEEAPRVDAFVISVGGGSQAVGALTVARECGAEVEIYGVQAAAAPTIHDSWHAKRPVLREVGPTLAEGLDTRDVYELTFGTLLEGLAGFITVSEAELSGAVRLLLRSTHTLVEGAGAAGLAGLLKLRDRLAGKTVAIILSGGNIEQRDLIRVLAGEP